MGNDTDSSRFRPLGEMGIDGGRLRGAVAEPGLNQAQVDAGFEQVGGPGMAQGMD